MRVTHNLWKVSNGWILVPEGCDRVLSTTEAPQAAVFKTLKEFSDWKPKQKRNRKTNLLPKIHAAVEQSKPQ